MTQPEKRKTLLGRATSMKPQHQIREEEELNALLAEQKKQQDGAVDDKTDSASKDEPNHDWEKRYRDLHSYSTKQMNALKVEIEELKKAKVEPVTLPKTQEEFDTLKSIDPNGYQFVTQLADAIAQEKVKEYDAKLAELTTQLNQSNIKKAELEIRKVHADFDEIVNSDEFHKWAELQTDEVKSWIYDNPDEPVKAIKALSLFKYETGWGTNKTSTSQQNVTDGAMDINIRTKHMTPDSVDRNHPAYIWKESEIAKMRPEEFEKWEEVISLASREGRVVIGQ